MASRSISVEIDKRELQRVVDKIDAYAKRVGKASKKTSILRKAAKPVIKAAKANAIKSEDKVIKFYGRKGSKSRAYVYRGDLARSIGTKKFKRNPNIYIGPLWKNVKGKIVFKGRDTWGRQAFWVEYGTASGQPARPYMRPAAKASASEVLRVLTQEYKKLTNAV